MTSPLDSLFSVIVLAGSRGENDPVATGCGVSHKAIAPLDGRVMVEHVLETLARWPSLTELIVVIEDPAIVENLAVVRRLRSSGVLRIIPAANSPASSVIHALDEVRRYPALLTTADHPLLTLAMVDEFVADIDASSDVAALVASDRTILREYPDSIRTYLRFADVSVSGCNLFAVSNPKGRRVFEFWRRIERDRKRPWRMALGLGVGTLVRYALGWLSLADAIAALGARAGIRGHVVQSSFAEAAIDVDKIDDLRLAERILERRRYASIPD